MDTSRSLNGAALSEVVDRLRLTLEGLDESTPTGLLAFDDDPRWIVEIGATPREVAEALRNLTLQGNYTLLNDALFVATRELENGGVLLLATDGRDENSAVVVDDIARRCEAQNVRIVSIGTGRTVEEKALRRLALLSNGAYLGPVASVDASAVAEGVKTAQAAVAASPSRSSTASRPGVSPAQGPPATSSAPAATASSEPGSSSGLGPSAAQSPTAVESQDGGPPNPSNTKAPNGLEKLGHPAFLALPAILFMLFLLMRRRGTKGSGSDGDDEEVHEALRVAELQNKDMADAEEIRLELAQSEDAKEEEAPEVTVDTAVFQRMTLDERLDRTRVLSNHSVLIMRKLGEAPRTFMLDRMKAFAVGRDRVKNTLGIPDPALSAQHFKIVPRGEDYYFVDLESTNGSYVNGRKVGAKRLRHSDVIRAGQVEFEYQSYSNI